MPPSISVRVRSSVRLVKSVEQCGLAERSYVAKGNFSVGLQKAVRWVRTVSVVRHHGQSGKPIPRSSNGWFWRNLPFPGGLSNGGFVPSYGAQPPAPLDQSRTKPLAPTKVWFSPYPTPSIRPMRYVRWGYLGQRSARLIVTRGDIDDFMEM